MRSEPTFHPDPAPPADPGERPDTKGRSGAVIVALFVAAVLGAAIALIVAGGLAGPLGRGLRSWPGALMVGGMFVALATIAVWAAVRQRRRSRPSQVTAAAFAAQHGLDYKAKASRTALEHFGPLPGVPLRGRILHLFEGVVDGRPTAIYRHELMIHTGYAAVPVHHTVALCTGPQWPILGIAPRTRLGRVARRLGMQRGHELDRADFNAAFRVTCDDEDFVIALLDPDMQAFLLQHPTVTWHVLPGVVATVWRGATPFGALEDAIVRLRKFWTLAPNELAHWLS